MKLSYLVCGLLTTIQNYGKPHVQTLSWLNYAQKQEVRQRNHKMIGLQFNALINWSNWSLSKEFEDQMVFE